ncbi:MAG: glycosyltransferase family 4 protein [Pseudomonadota bacterium]
MKVCFICVEIFAWSKYGGFGRATRMIGRELVRRGIEVSAVVPRRRGQREVEQLDGIQVLSFAPEWPFTMTRLVRQCDADIYHSENPSLGTYLAQRALPARKHVVTFRDPKEFRDWMIELRKPSASRLQVLLNWLYEDSLLVHSSMRKMDGVYATAPSINPKLKRKFGFDRDLELLATPVSLNGEVVKASCPTVCFIGRWDRRKRPEFFFELAREFPNVEFLAVGRSNSKAWEDKLRNRYGNISNLKLLGFLDQFRSAELQEILGRSWILVSTAAREGLPTVFLEALANKCAILSHVNPDQIAERFGYHAHADDFKKGLETLLKQGTWRQKGQGGYEYIRDTYELDSVIDKHIAVYQSLVNSN